MDQKGFVSITIRLKKKRKAISSDLDDILIKRPRRQATKPPILYDSSNTDLHDRAVSELTTQATKSPVLYDSSTDGSKYHPPTDSDDYSDNLLISDVSDSTAIVTLSDASDSTEEVTLIIASIKISRRIRLVPKRRYLAKTLAVKP